MARPQTPAPAPALPGLVRARVAEGRARARADSLRRAAEVELAEVDAVARVLVDLPLAHLDRPFDYAVPAALSDAAQPGVRVKVRFAGQEVAGYLVARVPASQHTGRLTPLRRVVGAEPVLSPAVAALAGLVAERYAGTRSDVLRLAVPPRHAKVEHETPLGPPPTGGVASAPEDERTAWAGYDRAAAFLSHLGSGGSPRAVWHAEPGADWPRMIAQAAARVTEAGRGVLVCVPDVKDATRMSAALEAALGRDRHVCLTADQGPARRYRDFLAVSRGHRRVVVGTRSSAFAPVHDLGLVVIWDDGDDLHAEPRAPYPHTREVLLLRAEQEGCAALVGGFACSVEAAQLVATGWAAQLSPTRAALREAVRVTVAGATDHDLRRDPLARTSRMPQQVHHAISTGLESGPVLVQTPRSGYAAALACERCRTPARCRQCQGPLTIRAATEPPGCRWCGATHPAWSCVECGHRGLRAPVVGETRTAEELGRSFPGARVVSSSAGHVVSSVPDRTAIVVATPGAEPWVDDAVARDHGGYAAVVLLDTWLLLDRSDLRADEEAVRRWSNAVGLVRPGGQVVAVGDPASASLQALIRWGQPGFAARESRQRAEAHLPPASRMATVDGSPGAVDDAMTLLAAPPEAEILGPVPTGDDTCRVVLRVPRRHGPALSAALGELQRLRSARKLDPVRVQVDPVGL